MIVLKVYNEIYLINNIFRIQVIPAEFKIVLLIEGIAMSENYAQYSEYIIDCNYADKVADELTKYLAETIASEKAKCIDLVKIVRIIERHIEREMKYESVANR